MQERDSAKKIVAILEQGISSLNEQTMARLASARRQAVASMNAGARADDAGLAHVAPVQVISTYLHAPGRHAWVPGVFALGCLLLVLALIQINLQKNREPVVADALLLASDLPPEAYVDEGFDAWLKNSSKP